MDYRREDGSRHHIAAVEEWLDKARRDLCLAERLASDGSFPDAACFHAQQAVEKLLKAALIARAVPIPRTHDLVHLDGLLGPLVRGWAFDRTSLATLSVAAVAYRYPGLTASATDAAGAFATARAVWQTLRPLI